METLTVITFILGMIFGSLMLGVATFIYFKRQIFPFGAIIMVVFGTLLLGLSIWQSAKIQVDADGNVTASFEKMEKQMREKSQEVDQKIDDIKKAIKLDSSSLSKLRNSEKVNRLIENGQYEEAIKLDPQNVIAYMRMIENLVAQGQYKKATDFYSLLNTSNESGVGYSVYPDLIFAFDQIGKGSQANILIQQLRMKICSDINNGYGYLSRSQQIGWIKEGLEKYLDSYKQDVVKKNAKTLVAELNTDIAKLTS